MSETFTGGRGQVWGPHFKKGAAKWERGQKRALRRTRALGSRPSRERQKNLVPFSLLRRRLRSDVIAGSESLRGERFLRAEQSKSQWVEAEAREIQTGEKGADF